MLKFCLYFPLLMFFKEFFNYKLLFNCEYQNKSPEAYSTTNIFRLSRRLWRNNFSSSKTSSRRLQNVFTRHFPKTSSRRLCKTTSSWLQDPVHTGRKLNVQRVFRTPYVRSIYVLCLRGTFSKTSSKCVWKTSFKDVFKASLQDLFKTSSRRRLIVISWRSLEDVL